MKDKEQKKKIPTLQAMTPPEEKAFEACRDKLYKIAKASNYKTDAENKDLFTECIYKDLIGRLSFNKDFGENGSYNFIVQSDLQRNHKKFKIYESSLENGRWT